MKVQVTETEVSIQRGDFDVFPLIDVATIVLEIKSYRVER